MKGKGSGGGKVIRIGDSAAAFIEEYAAAKELNTKDAADKLILYAQARLAALAKWQDAQKAKALAKEAKKAKRKGEA